LKTLDFEGHVFSGKGEGAKFVMLPWVKAQMTEKLGFTPYSGTLNIKLTEKSVSLKKLLGKAKSMEILPAEGFGCGRLFKAFLENLPCAVVVPEIANYPEDVVEVVASVNLREKLQLKDGDAVKIKILLE
jgi:riboflavin kinase